MDSSSPSKSHVGSSSRPSSAWSKTSQSSMVVDSNAPGNVDLTVQRTSHGKRKMPSYDTASDRDRHGEGSPTALNSAKAPSVVPVPRASASDHQRRRRRQRREAHGSEDSMAGPSPEDTPHGHPQGNNEGSTSSPGQNAPSMTPVTNLGASSCPTCWLCRGPATSGRVVELVAHDQGPAMSPDSGAWMPDISGYFGTNTQDIPSYSLQPVGQPEAWESTNTSSAQIQVPMFPVGWTGNEQGDGSSMAWSPNAYDGFGNVSYTGFPGSSVTFTPASGGLDSNAGSMDGYGSRSGGGQDSSLVTQFDGGLFGSDVGSTGPVISSPSGMNPESQDGRRMSGN